MPNRWDSARAARMSELERLAYRASLLGPGSSSAKLVVEDPLDGGLVRVLYVAGAAGDPDALELDALLALEDRFRGRAHEDELAPLLERCAFGRSARPPGLDLRPA